MAAARPPISLQGTADAVRQYAWLFRDIKNRNVEVGFIYQLDAVALSLGRCHARHAAMCCAAPHPLLRVY